MIRTFLDLALQQSTAMRALMVVLGVVLTAVALGALLAVVLPAWDAIGDAFRRTFGSWWMDRHARSMRKRMAAVEKDMAAERKRLRAAADIGRR